MELDFMLLLVGYVGMSVAWLLSRWEIRQQRLAIKNLNKVILGLLEAQRGPD